MTWSKGLRAVLVAFVVVAFAPRGGRAVYAASPSAVHAFDFEIGTWSMRVRKLDDPLASSPRWISVSGLTHIVQPIWGGRAILAQLEAASPEPHFLGSLLHLYDVHAKRWRVFWVDAGDASIDPPLVGGFAGGRGVLEGAGSIGGKADRVRVVYDEISHASFRTQQSFSRDGGATWTLDEVTIFTRE